LYHGLLALVVFALLLGRFGLPAAEALRCGPKPSADARLARRLAFLGSLLGLRPRVELAAHQFHLRDLGSVALPESQTQKARVAAGPGLEAGRNGVEQLADDLTTPRLAMVMIRSTNGRSSLARGTVVIRCSCRSSAVA
jgi:hypothetical protein